MSATMLASGTKPVPSVVSRIQDIPRAKIHESKTNPRRLFDEAKLADLAENIRQHGVLQPILVRPLPDREPGTSELVAGGRRLRASKLAKREVAAKLLATLFCGEMFSYFSPPRYSLVGEGGFSSPSCGKIHRIPETAPSVRRKGEAKSKVYVKHHGGSLCQPTTK